MSLCPLLINYVSCVENRRFPANGCFVTASVFTGFLDIYLTSQMKEASY